MQRRRSWWIYGGAFALISCSLALMDARPTESEPEVATGWQVTLLKHGKLVQITHYDQLPSDWRNLISDDPNVSVHVEPISDRNHGARFLGRALAPADRQMVEFLLLLPPATLLICLFRNVVGLNSFGTFAPALLGLSFRDVESLLGVFVVLTIISAGWWLRRGLNELHLLQVPRTALLLSCVVILLLGLILALSGPGPRAVSLFPLVILTGMIERFWSMEEEEGAASSLNTLGFTLLLAGCVWALATISAVSQWMLHHPETLGLVMAGQLLLGRYTGFRLLELYRFRCLMKQEEKVLRSQAHVIASVLPVRAERKIRRTA